MTPRLRITPELRLHLHVMMRYRRWGEKLILIPVVLMVYLIIQSMLGRSIMYNLENPEMEAVFKGVLLLLWPVFLMGVLATWQIYRTAYLAFGVPRAVGYLALTSVFALLPGYLLLRWYPLLYGSVLAIPLWFGIFLVPSMMKEEIRRRYGSLDHSGIPSLDDE